MDQVFFSGSRSSRKHLLLATATLFVFFIGESVLRAQEVPAGPQGPPPEHKVTRIGNVAEPEAPPSLPEAEIIRRLSAKEDLYARARRGYTFRRTVRVQEFGNPDGSASGEYVLITQQTRNSDGEIFDKVVQRPQSTLRYMHLVTDDVETLDRYPAYALTSAQLVKYNLKFVGKEKVDDVDCYIFEAKPKLIERTHPLFEGIVWVDDKYLEIVKTYGKWVTDLGAISTPALPFTMFDTYREYVDGKFWFPVYARSDDTMNVNGLDLPIRVTIHWSDFKPVADAAAPTNPPPANTAPTTPPPAPAKPSPPSQ